jgi:hypothetical protein
MTDDKKMKLSEQLTYSTVLIRCLYKDGTQGTGTGFMMHLCKDTTDNTCIPVIITNKHVVNNSVKCYFDLCKTDTNGKPLDKDVLSITYNGEPLWIQHPNPNIDLCCLPISHCLNGFKSNGIVPFYIPLDTALIPKQEIINDLFAIEDIIMIGYPKGLSDTVNHKPVIRKGITATQIKYDFQGESQFLIDCSCFPGSSGSPVFICNEGKVSKNSGLYMNECLLFIGILFAGPQFKATGEIVLTNISVTPTPIIDIPMNLGYVIKSKEVLAFENLLRDLEIKGATQ